MLFSRDTHLSRGPNMCMLSDYSSQRLSSKQREATCAATRAYLHVSRSCMHNVKSHFTSKYG